MAPLSNKKSLILILSAIIIITGSTYLISILARGYQINFNQDRLIKATGLLSATSAPKSASVYINDRLTTATNDTVNLSPGDYNIRIIKDGYLPWQKNIQIKKEVVFQTDAHLFRAVPDLNPLTLTGAINPVVSPDNSLIVYAVASASAAQNNGLYKLNLNSRPLPLSKNLPKQIYPDFPGIDWSQFTFEFSPDSRSILATNQSQKTTYLIDLDAPVSRSNLYDISHQLPIIEQEWQQLVNQIVKNKIKNLPEEIVQLISTSSAESVSFSSTDNKILYLAATDGSIKDRYITPPPAQSTQTQTRQIQAHHYYVYDLTNDTNFLIGHVDSIQNPFWLPNSNNIIYVRDQQIRTVEYDNTNDHTLFANNFNQDIVYPWPDGSRIITITSAYLGAPENLYAITIH